MVGDQVLAHMQADQRQAVQLQMHLMPASSLAFQVLDALLKGLAEEHLQGLLSELYNCTGEPESEYKVRLGQAMQLTAQHALLSMQAGCMASLTRSTHDWPFSVPRCLVRRSGSRVGSTRAGAACMDPWETRY